MADLCRNGLHEMTAENRTSESRCRACRNASYRAKRERIKSNPKAMLKKRIASERTVAWSRFADVSTPAKKVEWAVKIVDSGWADSEADLDRLVEGLARAKMRYLPKRADELTQEIVDAARMELSSALDEVVGVDKKAPLKHLHVKPGAERAWDRFNRALREASETGENLPNCHGKPELYSDYDDDSIPTPEEAYELCADCPLLSLCASFAEEERPAWGVWSSEVWIDGEPVG